MDTLFSRHLEGAVNALSKSPHEFEPSSSSLIALRAVYSRHHDALGYLS